MIKAIECFCKIADYPHGSIGSNEEDVKIKIAIPFLKCLGYQEDDFNYEGKTGKGYIDIKVPNVPIPLVVEVKKLKTNLDLYVGQLENYVFQVYSAQAKAVLAILTNGIEFRIYGVARPFQKGSLSEFLLYAFSIAEFKDLKAVEILTALLSKERNVSGEILQSLKQREAEVQSVKKLELAFESEKSALETQIREIEKQKVKLEQDLKKHEENHKKSLSEVYPGIDFYPKRTGPASPVLTSWSGSYSHAASGAIIELLRRAGANSLEKSVTRKWIDEQLLGKFSGVNTEQSVSFGLIELRDKHNMINGDWQKLRRIYLIRA